MQLHVSHAHHCVCLWQPTSRLHPAPPPTQPQLLRLTWGAAECRRHSRRGAPLALAAAAALALAGIAYGQPAAPADEEAADAPYGNCAPPLLWHCSPPGTAVRCHASQPPAAERPHAVRAVNAELLTVHKQPPPPLRHTSVCAAEMRSERGLGLA